MSQAHLHSVNGDARFEAGTETTDHGAPCSATPPTGDGGDRAKRATSKARADKPLPSDRLRFDNQIKVLRAVAATSGNARRGSTAEAMSAAIDLSGNTGGLNSRFFRSAGWFEAVGRGEYTASPGLLSYNQHITIDPDAQYDATAMMRTEVKDSWFWHTLEPMLANGQPISIKLAKLELAKASGATNHTVQLETVIAWLEWVGLITRDGDQIRLRDANVAGDAGPSLMTDDLLVAGSPEATSVDTPEPDSAPDTAHDDFEASPAARPATSIDTDAIVSFNMSVRLTAAHMKALDEDQRNFVLALAERLRG